MKNTEQLTSSSYYHIYNRGVNRMSIFAHESNYAYFLKKYLEYIGPIADTYAYCLLPNHFHFLIRTKDEGEIREELSHKVPFDKLTYRSRLAFNSHIFSTAIPRHSTNNKGVAESSSNFLFAELK